MADGAIHFKKWFLYMYHLSSSSYDLLCNSGCIVLPSGRTSRDYTLYIDNKPGFQNDADEQLCEMIGFDSLHTHENETEQITIYISTITDKGLVTYKMLNLLS